MVSKIVILVLFAVLMIGIGLATRKSAKDVNSFVLGGRSVGPWMTAFAYGTSYFSAVIFIGYAGQFGWGYGLSATWIGIGNALVGSLLPWLILGNRTRIMTKSMNVSTMPEFFEKRYNSKALKTAAAMIVFLFLIPYTASVYNGLSTLFNAAFPAVPYTAWIIIMAVFTAVYVILGGYKATAINDFVQGIVMLLGIAAVVICAVNDKGGISAVYENIGMIDSGSAHGSFNSVLGPDPLNLIGVVILTSLGTWGLPQMVQKFYAIKDRPSVKRGAVISTFFAIVVAGGSYFLGGLGRLFCTTDSADTSKAFIKILANGKPDFDSMVPAILESSVPDVLFGLVVVLVLSASMSTLAGLVLSSSSTMTIDLIKPFVKKGMSDKKQVLVMRIFIAVFLLISVLIAANKQALNDMGINISALMGISWGTLAGSFLAPFLYGLFSKKITKAAVWTSLITGVGITVMSMVLFNLGLFPELTAKAAAFTVGGYGFNLASPINWGAITMIISLIEVPVVSALTGAEKAKKQSEKLFECYSVKE